VSTPIQSADHCVVRIEALNEASSTASLEAGRALLLEYGRHILSVEGPARFCFGKLEDEVRELPQSYASMGGECLVAWVDQSAAGCVTYRALSAMPGACEMKRLWVRPEFRGLKVGERLTLALVERARVSGFTAVCLDTVPETMGAAYRMYLRLGFAECPAFHKSATEGMLFMRRSLE
jgi:ribosomal protein S18 acetylase RimI-like enzyme